MTHHIHAFLYTRYTKAATTLKQYTMKFDIICFSHLGWNFVYQRPQHLLSRFSKHVRVFFIEEPVFDSLCNRYEINKNAQEVHVVTPHLIAGQRAEDIVKHQKLLIDAMMTQMDIQKYILWYYSPMAMAFSDHLSSLATVYDCMDELSAFRFAAPELTYFETELLKKSDVVFTGGHSLYEAKKHRHKNIHPFPSSIDKEHFAVARNTSIEPEDQSTIPHPRIGFYGVLDERLNIALLDGIAERRPDWNFVMIGPVVKIDRSVLPTHRNIHYLGSKNYSDLPRYLAGWDVAMMPFALNESTRFISPTKTPEYLSGGKPVVSTPITDVVTPYGRDGLVSIADTPEDFIAAIQNVLDKSDRQWLGKVDSFLDGISWDKTWQEMSLLIAKAIANKTNVHQNATDYV